MDATYKIQDSIHVFSLAHKYVSGITGTCQTFGTSLFFYYRLPFYYRLILVSIIFSAILIPSTAAEVIPPAYPGPSPQG